MDLVLLLKVPCLLFVTLCLQVSSRAPNPRATIQDGAIVKDRWERTLRIFIALNHSWRFCLWAAAIAEIVVVIARVFPSLPFPHTVLSILLFGGGNHRIRITPATALAVPLIAVGTATRVWCYRELGKYFTFELSIQKDHELITTGPYSIVRHPSYTATIVNMFVIYLLHGTKGSWVRESVMMGSTLGKMVVYAFAAYTMTFSVALLRRTKEEDRELQLKFGNQWDDWAAEVPYSLVPGII
ncbi:hypothetical protein AX15_006034 [Amanita polypyramis BW_CC]|nr:hypothetical protein AX15_006034 [Amanita polypyramis BW_CC]